MSEHAQPGHPHRDLDREAGRPAAGDGRPAAQRPQHQQQSDPDEGGSPYLVEDGPQRRPVHEGAGAARWSTPPAADDAQRGEQRQRGDAAEQAAADIQVGPGPLPSASRRNASPADEQQAAQERQRPVDAETDPDAGAGRAGGEQAGCQAVVGAAGARAEGERAVLGVAVVRHDVRGQIVVPSMQVRQRASTDWSDTALVGITGTGHPAAVVDQRGTGRWSWPASSNCTETTAGGAHRRVVRALGGTGPGQGGMRRRRGGRRDDQREGRRQGRPSCPPGPPDPAATCRRHRRRGACRSWSRPPCGRCRRCRSRAGSRCAYTPWLSSYPGHRPDVQQRPGRGDEVAADGVALRLRRVVSAAPPARAWT